MSEYPPDLPRLRVLETYLRLQLAQVRAAIERTETAQPAQGDGSPAQDLDPLDINDNNHYRDPRHGQPRSDTLKWWRIQPAMSTADVGLQPAMLHRGDCIGLPRGLPLLDRREALLALAEPDIESCKRCRPDIGLG